MVMVWLEGGQGEVRGACGPLPTDPPGDCLETVVAKHLPMWNQSPRSQVQMGTRAKCTENWPSRVCAPHSWVGALDSPCGPLVHGTLVHAWGPMGVPLVKWVQFNPNT